MKLHNITPDSQIDDMPISIFPTLFKDIHGSWYAGGYTNDKQWHIHTQDQNNERTRVTDVVAWVYIDDIEEITV